MSIHLILIVNVVIIARKYKTIGIIPMATLNTGLGWVAGDAERILVAVGIGVSEYTINEMIVCMNELGGMSSTLVSTVRGLLSDYDSAVTVEKTVNTGADGGKTLVKADVLEWETNKGGRYEAITIEKRRNVNDLLTIFSFCPIVDARMGSQGTMLYRS